MAGEAGGEGAGCTGRLWRHRDASALASHTAPSLVRQVGSCRLDAVQPHRGMSPLPLARGRQPNRCAARPPGVLRALLMAPNNRGDRARRVRCAAAEVACALRRDESAAGRLRRCTRPRHGAHTTPDGNGSAVRRCSERGRPCGYGCGMHNAARRRTRPYDAELQCLNVEAAVCATRRHNRAAVQRQGR